MSQNRKYFKLTPGGKAEAAVNEFTGMWQEAKSSAAKFSEKYSGDRILRKGGRVLGLTFKDSPPDGWKLENREYSAYRPVKKHLPEVYDEFKNILPTPSAHKLAELLGVEPVWTDSLEIHFPNFQYIGDLCILDQHVDSEIPEGATPLKMSEYWALKEEQ